MSVGGKRPENFAANVHSQFGEDGIIAELLRRLGKVASPTGWCVEFGAWDGLHHSNTARLSRDEGYACVLIEADTARAKKLAASLPDKAISFCGRVEPEGANRLDAYLARTPIPHEFDLLSIDIDGHDYWVWAGVEKYRARVVVIEFNPTMPNALYYRQPREGAAQHGSSPLALAKLGEAKGYRLVAGTHCNLLFVDESMAELAGIAALSLDEANPEGSEGQYLFVGYDGTILSNREAVGLRWHGVEVPIARLQVMPRAIRRFSGDYTTLQRFAYRVWARLFARPPRSF